MYTLKIFSQLLFEIDVFFVCTYAIVRDATVLIRHASTTQVFIKVAINGIKKL